jgi:hypothetical protein
LEPEEVVNDGNDRFVIVVAVADLNGISDIKSVVADLSELEGPYAKELGDSGRAGDSLAEDGIYSLRVDVPSAVSAGEKSIRVYVTDNSGESVSGMSMLTIRSAGGDKGVGESGALPGFDSAVALVSLVLIIILTRAKNHI